MFSPFGIPISTWVRKKEKEKIEPLVRHRLGETLKK